MSDCECLTKCPFFNDMMLGMPNIAEKMKNQFCLNNNTECARYMVFKVLGREKVPSDLFPVQVYRVEDILKYR